MRLTIEGEPKMRLTPAQKTWLSAFAPSAVILLIIVLATLRSQGALQSSIELNNLFWVMAIICVGSFCSFVVCTIWPSKKDRLKARQRRRREMRSQRA